MSTELYSVERLLFMARMHRKVIEYYQFVIEHLKPSDRERSQILRRISREEKALAVIGQLAGLKERLEDVPIDLAALEHAIEEPEEELETIQG